MSFATKSTEFDVRLARARDLLERGEQSGAIDELWEAEAFARGRADAIREVLDFSSGFEWRVEPEQASRLVELVAALEHDAEEASPRLPAPPASGGAVIRWQIAIALEGFALWVIYAFSAEPLFAACPRGGANDFLGGSWTGGQTAGGDLRAAAIIGWSLWVAAALAAWAIRSRLALINACYLGLFLSGLAVLWTTAPRVWGPRLCDGLPAPSSSTGIWILTSSWWLGVLTWLAAKRLLDRPTTPRLEAAAASGQDVDVDVRVLAESADRRSVI
jgi:hypothetical protein